jgi:ribose transport system permease protein
VNSLVERLKAVGSNQQAMLLFVLLAMVAFFTSQNPIFFSNAVFGNIISDWSPIVLIAVGQAFVIISGGIDLSVGSTVAIAGVVAAFAIRALTENGQSPTVTLSLGVLIAALTGLVVGAINAFLITKANMVPFIATLVTMGAGAGLAIVLTGGGPIGGGPDAAIQLSVAKVGPFSYPGLAIVVLVFVLGLVLHKARFGLYTFAIGSNEFAARAAGINTKRHLAKIYMLSGVLAGFAGFYYYLRLGSGAPTSGLGGELQAIAAVVIGGAALTGGEGRLSGTVLGALILTTVTSGLIIINVAANWKQVVVAILIAVAVLLQQSRQKSKSKSPKPLANLFKKKG